MFKDLFNSIATNLIPATVLFLLFLLALGAFVRRSDIPALAAGLGRLFVLVFVSPLSFLRKTLAEVADTERREEYESVRSDQFLIRRYLASLKASLVVGAILLLAMGLAGAWASLPSRVDFRILREKKEYLVVLGRQPEHFRAELAQFDDEWSQLKTKALTRWQLQTEQQLLALRLARLTLELSLPESLRVQLGPQTSPMPYSDYGSRENNAHEFFQTNQEVQGNVVANSYFSSLNEEKWLAGQLQEVDNRRHRSQPAWGEVRNKLAQVPNNVQHTEQEISEIQSAIRGQRRTAVNRFAGTLGGFYLFAWAIGLLIEGLSLVIRVAGDIRVLREQQPTPPLPGRNDETVISPVSLFRT
ncbi:MAG: hypothetical protein SF066_08535 [Thermoanaerobaculia bacterium]|nr:hypothetical protein [Thermoanaerobaculia bacterium]